MENTTESKAPYSFLGVHIGSAFYTDEIGKLWDMACARNLIDKLDTLNMIKSLKRIDREFEQFEAQVHSEETKERIHKRAGAQAERAGWLEEALLLQEESAAAIRDHAIPLLGIDPKKSYFDMENEDTGFIIFAKEKKVHKVDVGLVDMPEVYDSMVKKITETMSQGDADNLAQYGVSDSDTIFIDPKSGNSCAVRTRTVGAKGGLIADVNKLNVEIYSEDMSEGVGIILKSNSGWEMTARESAMLNGIRNDPELVELGVTSPKVYGHSMRAMSMTMASGCVSVEDLPEEKRSELIQRITKATGIIEKNTPEYLSGVVIDEQKVYGECQAETKPKASEAIAGLDKRINDESRDPEQREHSRKRKAVLECAVSIIDEKLMVAKPAMNAHDYFAESFWQRAIPVFDAMVGFGDAHELTIGDLSRKGMFNTALSDSRFSNWLYHEDTDTLYKIDENAPAMGSRYSFIARVADTSEAIPEEARDAMLEGMLDGNDTMQDAFMSLYITNLQTAFFNKKRCDKDPSPENSFHGMMRARLRRAKGYVSRIGDAKLEEEFKAGLMANFGEEVYSDVYNSTPSIGDDDKYASLPRSA